MRTKITAIAAAAALLLGACGGGEGGETEAPLDHEQAGYDHAQEEAASFGIERAAEVCDDYAAGDEDAWREHVIETMKGLSLTSDEAFRGTWNGLRDYCADLGGY